MFHLPAHCTNKSEFFQIKIILTVFLFVYFVSLSIWQEEARCFLNFLQFCGFQRLILYNKIALPKYSSTVFNQLPNIKE